MTESTIERGERVFLGAIVLAQLVTLLASDRGKVESCARM